jgi:hypothetical protein
VWAERHVFFNPVAGVAFSNRRLKRHIQNLSWRTDRHSDRRIERYIKIQPDIFSTNIIVFFLVSPGEMRELVLMSCPL